MIKRHGRSALTVVVSACLGIVATPQATLALSIPCGDRDKLVESLSSKYKETQVAIGLSKRNTEAFEVFASNSGSWTLVMTTTAGKTCVMAAGHSWTKIEKEANIPET